jgi:hypothetical protein
MYNQYNPEANIDSSNFLKKTLEVFRSFLFSEDIAKGSIRSYVSDVRHFLGWLLFFLEANHIKIQGVDEKWEVGRERLTSHPHPVALLKHINPKVLGAYKDYLVSNNVPLKTINRRFSSLRRFGLFCQAQNWSSLNPFETLKNVSLNQPFPETKYHLAEYRAHLWKNNSSKTTIKNYLNDIRQFLVWMERSSR